jgi:hypothetical protein
VALAGIKEIEHRFATRATNVGSESFLVNGIVKGYDESLKM